MIYFIYYQFDDDRVTQKDKPAAILPNVYHENFSYHSSSYSRYEYISQYDITCHSLEKFAVGNIHEKKFMVKYFRLSRLQTIMNCSIYLRLKNSMCLIFATLSFRQKFFHAEFLLNYVTLLTCKSHTNHKEEAGKHAGYNNELYMMWHYLIE